MGCCLVALVLAGAPRIALALWWFFEPARVVGVFGSWVYPLLGLLILPWTTIAYVWVAPGGLTTFEWIIVIVALLVDLGAHGGGGVSARRRRSA